MLKPQYAGGFCLGLALLAGCRTGPPQIQPLSGSARPVPIGVPSPPAAGGSRPVDLPEWPAHWEGEWVSLRDWAAFNGLPTPVRSSAEPGAHIVFRIEAAPGTLAVTAQDQVIRWNGVACWLAYRPKLVGGELQVFGTDLRKTVQPLLALDRPVRPAVRTVVIDPGHGGRDTGTRVAAGHGLEKEFVLDWATRVQALLVARGWNVVLTRNNDVSRSISERVAIANRARADLFISLHFNSSSPGLSGVETYCLTPTGLPSNLVRDGTDDLGEVYPNNTHDVANLQWAYRLHAALLAPTGAADRGVRRARFPGVLRWQQRPAVLIEAGYLSDPAEAKKIANPNYRQRLAEAVVHALEKARGPGT